MKCEINGNGFCHNSGSGIPETVAFRLRRLLNSCNITGILALLVAFAALQIFTARIAIVCIQAGEELLPGLSVGPDTVSATALAKLVRLLCTAGIALCTVSLALAIFAVCRYIRSRAMRRDGLIGFLCSLVSFAVTLTAILLCIFLLI